MNDHNKTKVQGLLDEIQAGELMCQAQQQTINNLVKEIKELRKTISAVRGHLTRWQNRDRGKQLKLFGKD
jgi:hypothetical protein